MFHPVGGVHEVFLDESNLSLCPSHKNSGTDKNSRTRPPEHEDAQQPSRPHGHTGSASDSLSSGTASGDDAPLLSAGPLPARAPHLAQRAVVGAHPGSQCTPLT